MTLESLDTFYAKGDPKVVGWTYQGIARVNGSVPEPPAAE
jgi:hypothetical protein